MLAHLVNRAAPLRVLGCAMAFLLFIAMPGIAIAQDARGSDPTSTTTAASNPGDPAQPTTDARSLWLFSEPKFITQGLDLAKKFVGDGTGTRKSGFYPELSNMNTGAGFVSAGPGYRQNLFGGKAFVDTSAALSWHLYKMVQARVEAPELATNRVTIGAQAMWRDDTQVSYSGLGTSPLMADQAQYRMQSADFVGYGAVRPAEWLSLGAEFGWLKSPRVMETAGTFNPDYPDARVLYANDPAMSEPSQPNFTHLELSVLANTLDSRSHPTEGGLYRAALTSYFAGNGGTYSFDQWEGEAVQMVPLGDKRVVLGLHGWTVSSKVGDGHSVPFYLIPSIGGHNTLRAFDDYQFHDQNLIVANAELRVALLAHLDVAAFYDAGNVAARYRDLNFDKTSIGAGLRLHMRKATFARLDVAHGAEGWQVMLRTSDPFKLSRLSRRTAVVPFVP